MGSVFQDIELEWGGRVYTIPSNRVMGAIARIEDVVTLPELQASFTRGGVPISKLSAAYSAILRYAGAKVTAEEIYADAFAGKDAGQLMMAAIMNLMTIMLPPAARAKLEEAMASGEGDNAPQDGADPGNSQPTAPASSRKPTRQRSAKANG
jgi:hypothetical protein